MQLDLNHVLFWMDAIRNSPESTRTLESFWKGQIESKTWLIEKMFSVMDSKLDPSIVIYGGWNGVLASLLFQTTYFEPSHITSIDIDPTCETIANTINKIEEMTGKFVAVTGDMCNTTLDADVIINTSCEHITQEQYNVWLAKQPNVLLVLQSNNYDIEEHVRTARNLEQFKEQSNLSVILWEGILELPLYTRYMIIGKK